MIKTISLFTGAGGLDTGFVQAGFNVSLANEIMPNACKTYKLNHPQTTLLEGDIAKYYDCFKQELGVQVVIGGPPCQGFSVAGKMDPNDQRSQMIWRYLDIVEITKPKVFVMENVKALGKLEKWASVREKYFQRAKSLGYTCHLFILNSADFGVSEKRERAIFIGSKTPYDSNGFLNVLEKEKSKPKTVRQLFKELPHFGEAGNENTCTAFITMAKNPIMRKDPYAGTIFNGMGRPIRLDGLCQTLPASMGGNKTPIIDQRFLDNPDAGDWVTKRHDEIRDGLYTPKFEWAPDFLRRLTIKEAALIQSFPKDYQFYGNKSSVYTQIGNAVPCGLAKAIAEAVKKYFF